MSRLMVDFQIGESLGQHAETPNNKKRRREINGAFYLVFFRQFCHYVGYS